MENQTASYMAKVSSMGNSKGVVIPANILRALSLKNQDLVQISVTITGINEPPAGNRGIYWKEKKRLEKEQEEKIGKPSD